MFFDIAEPIRAMSPLSGDNLTSLQVIVAEVVQASCLTRGKQDVKDLWVRLDLGQAGRISGIIRYIKIRVISLRAMILANLVRVVDHTFFLG